jgi:hypothetical protein
MPLIILHITGFILYTIALLWSVNIHYRKWRYGQQQPDTGNTTPIKHLPESFIRAAMFSPSMLFFLWADGFGWLNLMVVVFASLALTWLLFDGLFNLKRGKDWWFIGTVDKDESFFDNIKRWLGPVWTKIVQISIAVGSILLYIFS